MLHYRSWEYPTTILGCHEGQCWGTAAGTCWWRTLPSKRGLGNLLHYTGTHHSHILCQITSSHPHTLILSHPHTHILTPSSLIPSHPHTLTLSQGIWCQWHPGSDSSGKIPSETWDAGHQGGCGSTDSEVTSICSSLETEIIIPVITSPGRLHSGHWFRWYLCLGREGSHSTGEEGCLPKCTGRILCQQLFKSNGNYNILAFFRTLLPRRATQHGPMWHAYVREQRHHCSNRILATGLIEMKLPLSSNQRGPNKQVHLQFEIPALAGNTKTCLF